MKFDNVSVMNFNNAFRGLRNPLESWDKTDSSFGLDNWDYSTVDYDTAYEWCKQEFITPDDEERYDEAEGKYLNWLHKNGILDSILAGWPCHWAVDSRARQSTEGVKSQHGAAVEQAGFLAPHLVQEPGS